MKILLLSGPSGTGKTSIALQLTQNPNFHLIKSFTDRPRRVNERGDHFFIPTMFIKFMLTYNIVASTKINGYYYCSTFRQFDDDKINVYVVDKKGIDDVKKNFKDAQIFSVLVSKDNIDIDQIRKDRNIVVPDVKDVDLILMNNEELNDVVSFLELKALSFFGVE